MNNIKGLIAALALAVTGSVNAGVLTFELDHEFSGAVAPSGTGPWLTATFDDNGSAGTVTLSLEANLSSGEFIDNFYFNLDPNLHPINDLSISTPYAPELSGWVRGPDCCKADGDGFYDVQLNFYNSGANRFDATDIVTVYLIGNGITASSFDYLSAPGGGKGPFLAASHVQGTGAGNQDSGWIAPSNGTTQIPAPASMLLLGIGLLGLGFARKNRV